MRKPTIRFWLRDDRENLDGSCPVHLIYQIGGGRKYFATGIKLLPCNWDSDRQRAVYVNQRTAKQLLPGKNFALDFPTLKEIEEVNNSLTALVAQVRKIERVFTDGKTPYTVSKVIDQLKAENKGYAIKEPKTNSLLDFIDAYINDNAQTREAGSLTVYRSTKKHIEDYQRRFKTKVTFNGIDYSFFQSFQNYLIGVKKLSNTTVAKVLSTIKTFLNYARKHDIEVSDKYLDFRIKRETPDVIALTENEFKTLYNLNLSGNKRLAGVRDTFCFSCTTGLRYSDLAQLRPEHIRDSEVKITVKKTKQSLTIPLNNYAKAILAKYAGMYRPLPVISNQKMNDYLKELCQMVGIDTPVEIVRFSGAKRIEKVYPKYELISVHTGRKTFATLSLEKGMSAEEVMTITGHKDYKSFKRYVKITEERKKLVMHEAWDRPIKRRTKSN